MNHRLIAVLVSLVGQAGQAGLPFINLHEIAPGDSVDTIVEKAAHVIPTARQLAYHRDFYGHHLSDRSPAFEPQSETPIGANDTWIAATALAHLAPLLTRNVDHFNRIEGLEVVGY